MSQQTESVQGNIGSAGTLRLALPRPARNRIYVVQQVSVDAAVTADVDCGLFLDGALITSLEPRAGVASGEPYVTVRPGSGFYVEWSGATVGSVCSVTFIYDDGVS